MMKPMFFLIRKEIEKECGYKFREFTISVVKEPEPSFNVDLDGTTYTKKDEKVINQIYRTFDSQIKAKTNLDVDALVAEVDENNNGKIWVLFKDENGNPKKELL